MRKKYWFLISILVIAIDQISKYAALKFLTPFKIVPVMWGLNFTLTYNSGIAFGILNQSGGWYQPFFLIFGFMMSILLAIWLLRTAKDAYLLPLSISLILGGAIGNLIDRIQIHYVIDFIDLYVKSYHWPVFNLADSAICIGAGLMLFDMYKNP